LVVCALSLGPPAGGLEPVAHEHLSRGLACRVRSAQRVGERGQLRTDDRPRRQSTAIPQCSDRRDGGRDKHHGLTHGWSLSGVRSRLRPPLLNRSAWCRVRDYKRGPDVSTQSGDRQATYRELRERTKRQERGREENLKRIVELHRERRLHLLENREVALGADALD